MAVFGQCYDWMIGWHRRDRCPSELSYSQCRRGQVAFFGVCYSPYRLQTTPPPHSVPESQVNADIKQIAAAGFRYIRTYSQGGAGDGNKWNVAAAASCGLKVGLGVWIVPDDEAANQKSIDAAWAQLQANPSAAMHLVIGNEVDRKDVVVYQPSDILKAVKYAKAARSNYPAVPSSTLCDGMLQRDCPARGELAMGGRGKSLREHRLFDRVSVVWRCAAK